MLRLLIPLFFHLAASSVSRSNPVLSGYSLVAAPQNDPTFQALDSLLKIRHVELQGTLPEQVEVANNSTDFRIAYVDPLNNGSYFIVEGTYLKALNSFQQKSWFTLSTLNGSKVDSLKITDSAYAPQQLIRNIPGDNSNMDILYYSPAYSQVIGLKIPKNNYYFTPEGTPRVTTDVAPEFETFASTARLLQKVNSPQVRRPSRLLQQITPTQVQPTPVRPIDLSQYQAFQPSLILQQTVPQVPVEVAYADLFDQFNQQIVDQLKSTNISYTPFPAYPRSATTNILSVTPTLTPSSTTPTTLLPSVIPAQYSVVPPIYTVTSIPTSTSSGVLLSPRPVAILPQNNTPPVSTAQIQPVVVTTATFSLSQPQPRIDPQASIINTYRYSEIGSSPNYLIQQADPLLDTNLVSIIKQIKNQKQGVVLTMDTAYAEFVFLPLQNTTFYNVIFKNSNTFVTAGVRLPYSLLYFNTLSPQQINRLCSSFDSSGNCTSCSQRSYLSGYKICILVSPLCQTWSNSTGDCLSCYSGYGVNSGGCVLSSS